MGLFVLAYEVLFSADIGQSLKILLYFTYRHVKINGSPMSLTENSAVFRKTDFKKKSLIFKNPLIVLPFFCFFLLKAISCDNLAEVAEKNQYCILARPDDTSSLIRASVFPVCDNDQY